VPCSGTGSAAWEAAVANLTSPGDKHLVLINGYFGLRHCDMARARAAVLGSGGGPGDASPRAAGRPWSHVDAP